MINDATAQVTINNQIVQVMNDGTFSLVMDDLDPGLTPIQIAAE